MEPINSDTPNKPKRLWRNILIALLKTIAYLLVVSCSMVGGLGLIATCMPETSMASWAIGLLTLSFALVWSFGGVHIIGSEKLGMASIGYLSFFFLVAIVEEVVFRGYLLQMITDHFNYKIGIAISGIGFAIIHLENDYFTWIAFCNLALGGILMSLLYLKYRSLYAPIAFHWAWNYFQGNILGFDVSGNSVLGLLDIEVGAPNWLSGGNFGLEGSVITCILLFVSILYIWNTSKTQLAA